MVGLVGGLVAILKGFKSKSKPSGSKPLMKACLMSVMSGLRRVLFQSGCNANVYATNKNVAVPTKSPRFHGIAELFLLGCPFSDPLLKAEHLGITFHQLNTPPPPFLLHSSHSGKKRSLAGKGIGPGRRAQAKPEEKAQPHS